MRLRPSDLSTTVVDGQTVILDTAASLYLTTNTTGTVLLEALAEDTTAEALEALLCSRFGIDEATARRDCTAFLDQLRDRGFLVD